MASKRTAVSWKGKAIYDAESRELEVQSIHSLNRPCYWQFHVSIPHIVKNQDDDGGVQLRLITDQG